MAIRLDNLAQLLQATNRLAEAEPSMRGALAIEASLGRSIPSTKTVRGNYEALLAELAQDGQGKPGPRRQALDPRPAVQPCID